MRIVTWNVNSIRARENRVLNWLDQHRPDALCLQELKCTEDQFPFDGFDALGYQVQIHGQKTYNGVAIVTLDWPDDVEVAIPWADDDQARGIAATVDGVRIVSLYVPNGRSVENPAYQYKLAWLDRLRGLARCVRERRSADCAVRRLQHRARRPRCARPGRLAGAGVVLDAGARAAGGADRLGSLGRVSAVRRVGGRLHLCGTIGAPGCNGTWACGLTTI